ncbi:hypothetical protein [Corynebacterium sp.]|uniref:hypothetical protein n=1 Tax=Corynebacterium sp. TaxID=1720 RepID=UPI0028A81936|nr:hypothetical protein [Corynebacterium sp.]
MIAHASRPSRDECGFHAVDVDLPVRRIDDPSVPGAYERPETVLEQQRSAVEPGE